MTELTASYNTANLAQTLTVLNSMKQSSNIWDFTTTQTSISTQVYTAKTIANVKLSLKTLFLKNSTPHYINVYQTSHATIIMLQNLSNS